LEHEINISTHEHKELEWQLEERQNGDSSGKSTGSTLGSGEESEQQPRRRYAAVDGNAR
jgi:hypothetical protein